jgi:anti-anti-sigma regulatory factor
MAIVSEFLKIDGEDTAGCLQSAREKFNNTGATVLDFSSVRRIDPKTLRAMEELATLAEAKSVKISLRGVNVDIYKVLKLSRLALRFVFLT